MKLPILNALQTYTETVDSFGGLNRSDKISRGELHDMKNLTSDCAPLLSTRRARGKVLGLPNEGYICSKLLAGDNLCYTFDNLLFINSFPSYIGESSSDLTAVFDLGLSGDPDTFLVAVGSYILIFPDKKYVNTADYSDRGDIEYEKTISSAVFTPCDSSGNACENVTVSAEAPQNPQNGALWLDTSGETHIMKIWSENTGSWSEIVTSYVKISVSASIMPGLNAGDTVKISGITDSRLSSIDGYFEITAVGENYFIIPALIESTVSPFTSPFKVSRKMPEFDFIFECGNRLWACRCGENQDGKQVNEIYASKLGDFKNWNSFAGISTDSYAVSLGSEGAFTGAVNYLGYPTFFRENYIHKIYGSTPSQFQLRTVNAAGVQSGCGDSIADVSGTLFYKSRTAVCAYDGSAPSPVSQKLGDAVKCDSAVGAALGRKYYISMKYSDGSAALYVYDASRGMWHLEDNTDVASFASVQGELFYVEQSDKCTVRTVCGGGETDTEMFEWTAETGLIGTETPSKTYISALSVRMSLEPGGRVMVFIQYDSSGQWQHAASIASSDTRCFSLPIQPRRCDHLRLKLVGRGSAKIFSITSTLTRGSEL